MRLIDADALIDILGEMQGLCQTKAALVQNSKIWQQVKNMPTIEERKTGKWVEVHGYCTPGGDPVWCCSECGKGVHVYGIEHGTYGADISDGQWKACPNCSALMEGEQP